MICDTHRLFPKLLAIFVPDLVLDVGSMDAEDARRFRKALPDARIIAIEANPFNYREIAGDPRVSAARIEVQHRAVSSGDGKRAFYVERITDAESAWWKKGVSSLRTRPGNEDGVEGIEIEAICLESLLGELEPAPRSVALWADVEGTAYEALAGMGNASEIVSLIHVEVETRPVWEGQRLKPQVLQLAEDLGYAAIARGWTEGQHDIVLVRREALSRHRAAIDAALRAAVWVGRLRRAGMMLNLGALSRGLKRVLRP